MNRVLILTPDQRVRVFVSSTLRELAAEREAVRDAVRQMRLVPVMFEQGARAHPPRDVYRAYVAQSQVFIGVYAESYGWIAPGEPVSGLEDELTLAAPLPRLIYVKDPAEARDPRLADMLDGIREDAAVSYHHFRSTDELRDQVQQDLAVLLSERFEQARRRPLTLDAGRLPASRTPLIGREDDLAALTVLLTDEAVPLVTLTGTGGIGKTKLATAAAAQVADRFRDGARFVDLSAVGSAELVGEAIARGLGVRTSGAVPVTTDIAAWLRTRQLLLVVDNFEQLTDAAPVLSEILRAAAGVTALVTSRAPLRLADEQVYAVRPLPGPPDAVDDPAAVAAGSAAVRLFVDAARAAAPDFALTAANVGAVAEIVRRLEGLPLAIVLAAAKVRVLPPATIVEHLDDQLGLLTGGARDLPDRQRTLRDTIAWSYHLLQPDEQALFDRLGVFTGGWDLDALTAVADTHGDPFSLLEALIESALVGRDTTPDGDARFGMLDTIRTYALERLREGDAWAVAHRAHAAYYRRLAQAAQLTTEEGPAWLRRLELEHANAETALGWLLDHDDPATALELLWASWVFWWRRGHIDEVNRYLARILDGAARLSPSTTGQALLLAGGGAFASGRLEQAQTLLERGLPLLRAAGDQARVALILATLAPLAVERGDLERARRYQAEAEERAAGLHQDWQLSFVHSRLALMAAFDGHPYDAQAHLHVALDSSGAIHEEFAAAVAHYTWAVCLLANDDSGGARRHLVDGVTLTAEAGDEASTGTFLAAIAGLDSRRGDLVAAVRLAAAAGALRTPSHDLWLRACVAPWPPIDLDPEAVRERLGAGAYDAAWQAGEALDLDQAVAEAAAR